MSILDLVLVSMAVLSAFGGYRRGAVLQAFGLLGLAAGVLLAVLAVRPTTGTIDDASVRVAAAVGVVLVGAAIGNFAGWLAGSKVKARLAHPHAARTDAMLGSAISVAALGLTVWFLALNLANGPFPMLATAIQRSRVIELIDDSLPAPPPLLGGLERAATLLGFPDVFVGLPPAPAPPVADPLPADVAVAAELATASTVEILGDGCDTGLLNEGSGFVVASGYVVTNAHVVAGTSDQLVIDGDEHLAATVVAFDPRLDAAVLHVPNLTAPPVELATQEVPRSTGGAVLGYPGGPPLAVSAAGVRAVIDATGHDIYGAGRVERRLYELQTTVRPGNSGGPFVLTDGRAAGMVFASSTVDGGLAYALTAAEVAPIVETARFRTQPVSTGSCT